MGIRLYPLWCAKSDQRLCPAIAGYENGYVEICVWGGHRRDVWGSIGRYLDWIVLACVTERLGRPSLGP